MYVSVCIPRSYTKRVRGFAFALPVNGLRRDYLHVRAAVGWEVVVEGGVGVRKHSLDERACARLTVLIIRVSFCPTSRSSKPTGMTCRAHNNCVITQFVNTLRRFMICKNCNPLKRIVQRLSFFFFFFMVPARFNRPEWHSGVRGKGVSPLGIHRRTVGRVKFRPIVATIRMY